MASTPENRKVIERLYFITMDGTEADHVRQVEAACKAGIRWIQLRMKSADDDAFREAAFAAKKICKARDCALFINDRVEIAREVKAHGVHVGKQDMSVAEARRRLGEDALIGGTANTPEDIRMHYKQGADYIGLGPYRYTTTKKNLSPVLGLEGYRQIIIQLRAEGIVIPVIAIGGIERKDVTDLFRVGVHGIAFSGMLVHAGDPLTTVRMLEAATAGS